MSVHPNPETFEAFAEWTGRQPADKQYDYGNAGECACAQYANTLGVDFRSELAKARIQEMSAQMLPWQAGNDGAGYWKEIDNVARHMPHNFGNLTNNLRKKIVQMA